MILEVFVALLQAYIFAMLTAVIVVLANILVDILYAVVDPRIRYD